MTADGNYRNCYLPREKWRLAIILERLSTTERVGPKEKARFYGLF